MSHKPLLLLEVANGGRLACPFSPLVKVPGKTLITTGQINPFVRDLPVHWTFGKNVCSGLRF